MYTFWGDAKKDNKKKLKVELLTFSAYPKYPKTTKESFMKKTFWLAGLLGLAVMPLRAGTQDTVYVTTHDQVTINTDMKTGKNFFTEWGEFPSPDKEIRRMKMQVTLAH